MAVDDAATPQQQAAPAGDESHRVAEVPGTDVVALLPSALAPIVVHLHRPDGHGLVSGAGRQAQLLAVQLLQ